MMPLMTSRARRVWPLDWLHFSFFLAHMILLIVVRGRLEHWWWWLAFDVAAPASLVALILGSDSSRPRRDAVLRLVHACFVVPLAFTQVGLTIKALRLSDHAQALEEIDRALFGGTNPLEAIETLTHPLLTEIMQWAYTAYVLLPPAAVLLLAFRASPRIIARSLFSLLAILYLSYLGYYLVPAMGPNIHNILGPLLPIDEPVMPIYEFTNELPGVWLTELLRKVMFEAELTKKDCFPSGHTAMALACVFCGFRVSRFWGFLFLPVCLGVVLSTVYLRYHYVVDVAAGILLAVGVITVVEKLHGRFEDVLFSDSPARTRS